jgi:hypothetical protein
VIRRCLPTRCYHSLAGWLLLILATNVPIQGQEPGSDPIAIQGGLPSAAPLVDGQLKYFATDPALADDNLGQLTGPVVSAPVEVSPTGELLPIAPDDQRIKFLEPDQVELPVTLDLLALRSDRYMTYRSEEDAFTFLPGDGDQFGWISFESSNYLTQKQKRGFTNNINFHLLSGPKVVPLPPRLYDFEFGYQSRNSLSSRFSYDCSVTVGVYSDFEDSARDGVRFPAHTVGIFHASPRNDLVFGVDYLDRDDIKILPVAGICWHDPNISNLRYQMVFPRPRIDWTIDAESRMYVGGTLGGGTWDIEFPNEANDVLTYRDYRLVFGIEHAGEEGKLSGWEMGWVFSRKLEFRHLPQEFGLDDAFIIRWVTRQ